MMAWRGLAVLALVFLAAAGPPPLPEGRIAVGGGVMPVYRSADWDRAQPGVERAVIVQHGLSADARGYFRAGLHAREEAHAGARALVLAPWFLDPAQAGASGAGPDVLRWRRGAWAGGARSLSPAKVSSFAVVDAILARLADRARFPDLREIVLAGHSAGGQLVQRYAAVHHSLGFLAAEGIGLRFVVANPSSYLYFTPWRPAGTEGCARFDDWKYGFARGVPAYVEGTPPALEARYRTLDLTYLLGGLDTNPAAPALDRTCMAEAQGPNRDARGHAWFAHLLATGAAPRQRLAVVPGVGHSGGGMFGSPCGVAALFDVGECEK